MKHLQVKRRRHRAQELEYQDFFNSHLIFPDTLSHSIFLSRQ